MATTRKQIGYGSQGDEVKELQTQLNKNGYNLSVDGKFGPETQKAVKAYQKAKGLSVDGVVGSNTWGALLGSGNSLNSSATSGSDIKTNPYTKVDLTPYDGGFQLSDTGKAAQDKADKAYTVWQDYLNAGFASEHKDDHDAVYDQIMNRKEFSFDLNGDALYQQYKDKYIQQGKMAMQDTMGQAAAMTGGYGNSYASTSGNQAYQASLQNLNDIVPELYQMAYDRYNQEGQDLYNKYAMISDAMNTEYGMWVDKGNNLLADLNYATGRADTEYGKEYGQWSDNRTYDTNQYWNETNFGYGMERDAIEDEQHNQTMATSQAMAAIEAGIVPSEDILEMAGIDPATAKAMANSYKTNNKTNMADSYKTNGGSNASYVYCGVDKDGKATWRDSATGKTFTMDKTLNPYTGAYNNDVEYSAFKSNPYQPDNIDGIYLIGTNWFDERNGKSLEIYYNFKDDGYYIWNDYTNQYDVYKPSNDEEAQNIYTDVTTEGLKWWEIKHDANGNYQYVEVDKSNYSDNDGTGKKKNKEGEKN